MTALAFSADGRTLASGHDDGKVRFWDAATQKFVRRDQGPPEPVPVSAIAFSPSGEFVATAGEDRRRPRVGRDSHKLVRGTGEPHRPHPGAGLEPGREPAHLRRVGHVGPRVAAAANRPAHAPQQPRRPGSRARVQPGRQVPGVRRFGLRHPPVDRPGHGTVAAPVLRGHNDEIRCLALQPRRDEARQRRRGPGDPRLGRAATGKLARRAEPTGPDTRSR